MFARHRFAICGNISDGIAKNIFLTKKLRWNVCYKKIFDFCATLLMLFMVHWCCIEHLDYGNVFFAIVMVKGKCENILSKEFPALSFINDFLNSLLHTLFSTILECVYNTLRVE